MSYKQRKLIVTIPGVEGVQIVIHNEPDADNDGTVRVQFEDVDTWRDILMVAHHPDAIKALGFPVKPEPEAVEVVEVEGVIE